MGDFIDKVKKYIDPNSVQEDTEFEDDNYVYADEDAQDTLQPVTADYEPQEDEDMGDISNVVSLGSNTSTPIVIKKINTYPESQDAANVLKRKQIVILNLENCPHEDSQRSIDFLSGVAYANGGALKKIAGRAYLITPNNVPLTGDLEKFDPTEKNNMSFFEK